MKLFGKSESKSAEKSESKNLYQEIADRIMQQEDSLETLFSIMSNLPGELVWWFEGALKSRTHNGSYVEVDLQKSLDLTIRAIPSDIVVRKNRDPILKDIVEVGIQNKHGYRIETFEVTKINLKEGTLFVHDPLEPERKGTIPINNVVYVVDKVVKYTDPEWGKIVQILNIDYNIDELMDWVNNSIENVKNTDDFYDKENTLIKLEDRLRILKEDG